MKSTLLLLATLLALTASAQAPLYELWFTTGQVRHHGLLQAGTGDDDWMLRIRYCDPATGQTRLVEQRMRAETTRLGLCLRGQQVWDVQAQRPATGYAADNFYLLYGSDRQLYSQNRDARGANTGLTLTLLRDQQTCTARLAEFGWAPAERLAASK